MNYFLFIVNLLNNPYFYYRMKQIYFIVACASLAYPLQTYAQNYKGDNVPDYSAHILTPKSAPTPRINGAKIFGARPGSQFLYSIPATGQRPITFAAEGLPEGLTLDKNTGRISGTVKKEGEYRVKLTAKNKLGTYSRDFRIVIGDRIALTPPMGWNSWNCWGRDVTQEQVLSSAKGMAQSGLSDHGWQYINIDDGWQGNRGGEFNAIQPNKKFPNMEGLTKEVHDLGLKLGIYSTPWVGTYAAHIGSYADTPDGKYNFIEEGKINENYRYTLPEGDYMQYRKAVRYDSPYSFVKNDAKQWAAWKVDYLKYDWRPNDIQRVMEMHDALRQTDRDIVFSLSNNAPLCDAPALVKYADCWRTTGDIRDNWDNFSKIAFSQSRWAPFTGPGHWPDADMLVVGLVGWGPKLHYTKLTPDEQYTHITMWTITASPLLIGCDLSRLDPFTYSILSNDEVIEVNQDPLGIHGAPIVDTKDEAIYVKQLEDGSMAAAVFNKTIEPRDIAFNVKELGFYKPKNIRDLWRQKDVAVTAGVYTTCVNPHGAALYRIY